MLITFLAHAASHFNQAAFFTHVVTLTGTGTQTWKPQPMVKKHNSYLFFSRIDPNVTVALFEAPHNSNTYVEQWSKTGKDIPKENYMEDMKYRLRLSGNGVLAFTESESSKEFCDGTLTPFNHQQEQISLTDTTAVPPGMPKLSSEKLLCILYANAGGTSQIMELDVHNNDIVEYTYGNETGTITGTQEFSRNPNSYGYPALCIYFKIKNDFSVPRKFSLNVAGELSIPPEDLYPQPIVLPDPTASLPRTPSKSKSPRATAAPTPTKSSFIPKTPTQTRKVRIITDDPNITNTNTIQITDVEFARRAKVIKSPLTHKEVAAVATTASVSVGMIVSAVVLFLVYIHSKSKKMKETEEFQFDDSDIDETFSSSEYSYSYQYDYEYYNYSYGSGNSYSIQSNNILSDKSDDINRFYLDGPEETIEVI